MTGSVSDSDGVAEAELLIRESDEAVVWSAEIPAAGESAIDFSSTWWSQQTLPKENTTSKWRPWTEPVSTCILDSTVE